MKGLFNFFLISIINHINKIKFTSSQQREKKYLIILHTFMRKWTKTNLMWNRKQKATTPIWWWVLTKTNQPARPTATSYQQWYSESSPLRPGARGEWPLLKQYPCSWPTHQGRKKKKDVTNGKEKQLSQLAISTQKIQRIYRYSSTKIQRGQPKVPVAQQ